jgi:hypothetical protein
MPGLNSQVQHSWTQELLSVSKVIKGVNEESHSEKLNHKSWYIKPVQSSIDSQFLYMHEQVSLSKTNPRLSHILSVNEQQFSGEPWFSELSNVSEVSFHQFHNASLYLTYIV